MKNEGKGKEMERRGDAQNSIRSFSRSVFLHQLNQRPPKAVDGHLVRVKGVAQTAFLSSSSSSLDANANESEGRVKGEREKEGEKEKERKRKRKREKGDRRRETRRVH